MPPTSSDLTAREVTSAAASLTRYLRASRARFSISGGAAACIIRSAYGIRGRTTQDIDLVVQPEGSISAESISRWLPEHYPDAITFTETYGVKTPAMKFRRADGSIKLIDIEIFDVAVWPNRPQYNLDDPSNKTTEFEIDGVQVPVFAPSWMVREKIVTAYQRAGSKKEASDLDDVQGLLRIVEPNEIDLSHYEAAVQHVLGKTSPGMRLEMELKVVCPAVFGPPWQWHGLAGVYWRLNSANELQYLDNNLKRHQFKWDMELERWYFSDASQTWYYDVQDHDILVWA